MSISDDNYCIFCKKNSNSSKSVEHIIPESLGNKNAILPVGIVCDNCNNYFAIKIEKEVLNLSFYKSLRSRYGIESKKGKIPFDVGYLSNGSEVEVDINSENNSKTLNVIIPKKKDFNQLLNMENRNIYIPVENELIKNNPIFSRFLAKIAFEALASKGLNDREYIEYIVNEKALDKIRNYVRFGSGIKYWEYYQRRVYAEYNQDDLRKGRQKMYEYNIWTTEKDNNGYGLHLTLVLYGMEFTINLFEPKTSRYEKWLKLNNQKIPI